MLNQIERRAFPIEFRVEGDSQNIKGYAAVFNRLSEPLGGFVEKIAPGAFRKTLKEADVRALFNHDSNIVLGRSGAGTLKLKEDDKGLFMDIDPPDTQAARDVVALIERGDVNQASFAFRVIKDSWVNEEGKTPVRTLEEVQLFDVSPVTYPAYPQTTVDIRSMTVDATDTESIRAALDGLSREPGATPPPEPGEPSPTPPVEPVETHSEVQPRPFAQLVKEWKLEQEAGR